MESIGGLLPITVLYMGQCVLSIRLTFLTRYAYNGYTNEIVVTARGALLS